MTGWTYVLSFWCVLSLPLYACHCSCYPVSDMLDKRVLPGRHIGHGAHSAQMPRAYRRHQGLVRLIIIISFFYTWHSKRSFFLSSYHRLEERGWVAFPQHESGSLSVGGGDHDGDTIVLVKTRKKRMDQERYLDATQRCVFVTRGSGRFIFILGGVVKGSHEGLASVDFWRSSASESDGTGTCIPGSLAIVVLVGSSRRTPGSVWSARAESRGWRWWRW
jgi:hypothetical protein